MANGLLAMFDAITHEAMLFASIGFLVGGIDDLAIDLIHIGGWLRRRMRGPVRRPVLAQMQGGGAMRIAVFVPAWDEAAVIGAMLRSTLDRLDHPDYRLFVGAYPNDPATIAAIARMARADARVRPVLCARPGPTTKADCLNQLWAAMLADERVGAGRYDAVVLHDAEDLVHPGELRVHAHYLGDFDVTQTPVEPLIDPAGPLVSGHYCDEFAEAHGRTMPVRQSLRAALPLAGVGCGIARATLDRIAAARGGHPFDETSLTEDYELGLMIATLGGRGAFVRVAERPGGPLVATRARFPATLEAAVRQKARWMVGIALAGWDRTGWARAGAWREHWMRMRDRRAILSVLVLAAAYAALVGWAVSRVSHALAGDAPAIVDPGLAVLLSANAVLLGWRLAARAWFVGALYGWRQALWSLPRAMVSNLVALLAARRAMFRYVAMLRGAALSWDKTAHSFPEAEPAE